MKLYSTLTRRVEPVKPLSGKKINYFVCGPTVYDYSHIGHAKTYVQLDVLARTLKKLGFEIFYLQNITDIDDKIILRAKEQNTGYQELAAKFEAEYYRDMKLLNNTSVSKYAKATDYIPQIIDQVQTLIDKGHAYQNDDGIYFEIATFAEYGKLSGRQEVGEDDAQTRIDQSSQKRGWNDFCLWKFSKPGEPVWEAPFGSGRPGWHIEDTAITEHFFGPQYDIHGGAIDLIFPHHEAELTQMESISGKQFVSYWVHTGFLNIDAKKMSKSLGNFYTIREVVDKGYDPMAIRLLMLQSHYRSPINFSWDTLDASANRLKGLRAMADLLWQPIAQGKSMDIYEQKEEMLKALSDDLDTPKTLAVLSNIENKLTEQLIHADEQDKMKELLGFIDETLGLNLLDTSDITDSQKSLIKQREAARKNKDWREADKIRGELSTQDITIRDTACGSVWSRN